MTTILNTHAPKLVPFDPTDNEHRVAYWMLTKNRRQHATLRFILQEPFKNIPEMMKSKMLEFNAAKNFPVWDYQKIMASPIPAPPKSNTGSKIPVKNRN